MGLKRTTPTGRATIAEINRKIAATQGEQAGLISHRQLRTAGLSTEAIGRKVENGSLFLATQPKRPKKPQAERSSRPTRSRKSKRRSALTSGVFGSHPGRLGIDGLRWAGVLSGPPPSYLSHVSVCGLVGLEPQRERAIHVLRLGHRWDAPRGVVPHRTTWLPPTDLTVHRGVPATSVARALIDAAADVDRDRIDDLLDTAVRMKLYDNEGILRVLEERPTLKGARRLTEAVGRLDSTSGTFRSNFERRAMRLIQTSTIIPAPAVNVLVYGFESDLWFPGTRAIIECDGRDYHRSPAQIAKDEERERILRARGFVFLRLRWHQLVYEEARTLERIERFVLANLAAPVPPHGA